MNASTTPLESSSDDLIAQVLFLRLGLAGGGALLLHLSFVVALSSPRLPGNIFVLIIGGIVGLLMLIAAGLHKPPVSLRWMILFACVSEVIVRAVTWAQTSPSPDLVTIDPGLYTDFAGQLFLRGENPYTWDLAGVFDVYRISQAGGTPRLDGSFTSNFPYPALAFLFVVPFQALGLPGMFLVSLLAQIAALVLLFLVSPRSVQPLILLPVVVGVDFTLQSLIGVLDITWAVLLVGMIVAWRMPTVRAVLFGLAIAFKQSPWLAAPFLLIRLWRDESAESPICRVGYFSLISMATFLLINAPFILWDPDAWLEGVTEPFRDDLVLLSQGGLSSLTQFGLVNLPKEYYLVTTLSVFTLLLLVYWRHYDTLRDVLWVMPGIPMWFSYRSLESYWVYWIFPLLATLITRAPPSQPARKPSWASTLATMTVMMGALFAVGTFLSSSPSPIEVRPGLPMRVNASGYVTHIPVQVTNRSPRTLVPRLALQHRYSTLNALPWHIAEGPLSLQPGQSATFQIFTEDSLRTFRTHDTAQIVVTDAGGDYSLRGLGTIEPDHSYLWPDAIPNPTYRYWDAEQRVPIFWGLLNEPAGSGAVTLVQKDGRDALMLTLNATREGSNRVALDTWIVFPTKPFGIWVYSDSVPDDSASVLYGLEIADAQHRLWFLFNAPGHSVPPTAERHIIHRNIAPRVWTYQEIDLVSAYAEAGWFLPPLKRTSYRGLDIDLRTVNLRLFLAVNGSQGKLQAYFGPIEQDNYRIEPKTLMAETLDDPAGYYIRLAESHIRSRNYSRALEAYQRALQYSPNNSLVIDGIERIKQHLTGENPQ